MSTSSRRTARRCSSWGRSASDLVVLDADLASDCRTRAFELAYPDRFVQCGIAEQDMVSTAAGMARHGLLPVVNSFASFLASRANEQIYNQASEGSKVIYALHYAGLIPAGPGQVAPERSRHLAARGAPERRDRPAGLVRRRHGGCFAGRSRTRRRASRCGSRSAPRRGASSFPRSGLRSDGAACSATAATWC